MELTTTLFVVVIIIALLCQYMSVSLGVGYGTAMTPLLLIIGFAPLQIVPAVLLSQLLGGVIGGIAHHRAGHIHLDFKRDDELIKQRLRGFGYLPKSRDAKIVLILVLFGIAGVLIGVFTAVNIPRTALEAYIGALVLVIGLAVLLQRKKIRAFSWKGILAIGVLGSFNKGMSGGGYGPVVTGGQILSGVEGKSAVGITSLAEGLTCLVGVIAYILISKNPIDWKLAPWIIAGAVLSVPLSAKSVKIISTRKLELAIALLTIVLGIFTIVKTLK